MSLSVTSTGWFGIPGRIPGRDSHRVHAVHVSKPICGTRLPPDSEYQFCAHGLHINMIECQSCLRILQSEAADEAMIPQLVKLLETNAPLSRDHRDRIARIVRKRHKEVSTLNNRIQELERFVSAKLSK